jgi:hypothetical protein
MNRLCLPLALAVIFLSAGAEPDATQPLARNEPLEKFILGSLKNTGSLTHPKWDFALSVRAVRGTNMVTPVLEHLTPVGGVDSVVKARECTLQVDRKRNVLILDFRKVTGEGRELRFEAQRYVHEIPLPPDFGKQ